MAVHARQRQQASGRRIATQFNGAAEGHGFAAVTLCGVPQHERDPPRTSAIGGAPVEAQYQLTLMKIDDLS
jgi:hypothetical protein